MGNGRSSIGQEGEQEADLVLAIGTSLSGMNADRVVSTCASKAKKKQKTVLGSLSSKTRTLGSVIVSLQRTPHDIQIPRLRL